MRHRVVACDILRADDAAHLKLPQLAVHPHLLACSNDQVSIRQHLGDNAGEPQRHCFVAFDHAGAAVALPAELADTSVDALTALPSSFGNAASSPSRLGTPIVSLPVRVCGGGIFHVGGIGGVHQHRHDVADLRGTLILEKGAAARRATGLQVRSAGFPHVGIGMVTGRHFGSAVGSATAVMMGGRPSSDMRCRLPQADRPISKVQPARADPARLRVLLIAQPPG